MIRRIVLVMLLLPFTAHAQQENVLDVGSRSQLFIDQHVVYSAERIAFTPHPGRKRDEPVLKSDQPWEGGLVTAFGSTAIYDHEERIFKLWYCTGETADYFEEQTGANRPVICYATSRDGIVWEKLPVGTLHAKNKQPHNAVLTFHLPTVFKDTADPDAARRYKMIAFDVDRGYLLLLSPNGLTWTEQSGKAFLPISYVDDVVSGFRDQRTGEFVALPKQMTPVFGRSRRTIYESRSYDFRHWTPIVPALVADRRDDLGSLARIERVRPLLELKDNFNVIRTEFYGSGAYSAESCVVGFPWVFTVQANVKAINNQSGPIEVQLAVSREPGNWVRPFRTPIIPPGEPGAWDGGMILTASQAIDVGDEVWMYYGGMRHTHGELEETAGAIGLAVWPRDRFVSADSGSEGGTLTTVPLKFTGNRLEINAATKPGGSIEVELLDPAGRPIEGYPRSPTFSGDSLRHRVFDEAIDISELAGRPICVRFHLHDAELYGFAFRADR